MTSLVLSTNISALLYLVAGVCFIMALRGLSSASTSLAGNRYGMAGMFIAILTTIMMPQVQTYGLIISGIIIGGLIGTLIARKIEMTALPQLIAAFHSLVGMAAVLVAVDAYMQPEAFGIGAASAIKMSSLIEMSIGAAIGAITFTGSVVAFAKLQALIKSSPLVFPMQHPLNALIAVVLVGLIAAFVATESSFVFGLMIALAFLFGFLLILPIGGADMPVIVSMLNSYSGWAAAGIGFTLENNMLIITGALVGSSGAILSYIMCKGMNRSIVNVVLGGFGTGTSAGASSDGAGDVNRPYKSGVGEDAAFILKNASSVIIVPGYGMAVAQAQHVLRELSDVLKEQGVKVRYAIHPVAGRMPGHMNVLLAEANTPYEDVFELEEINRDFGTTDVAIVIGANDVTNPAAKSDPSSPIFGMPVLDVEKAKTVFFIKRSMSAGYAGVDNELFYKDNTIMLFGDAKKVIEDILKFVE
jgi:NAD(P) transhydrogenase subunit beta